MRRTTSPIGQAGIRDQGKSSDRFFYSFLLAIVYDNGTDTIFKPEQGEVNTPSGLPQLHYRNFLNFVLGPDKPFQVTSEEHPIKQAPFKETIDNLVLLDPARRETAQTRRKVTTSHSSVSWFHATYKPSLRFKSSLSTMPILTEDTYAMIFFGEGESCLTLCLKWNLIVTLHLTISSALFLTKRILDVIPF
ncbi:hypothetical protein BCR41DRAFT_368790 [Lobosporangium transversale]|uniref:Uncharacterized protein n=1 Tax=Lobosporangium transversale TaxID=64571 RepID=A0A1Y2GZG7_9FUNG|nr:hypothetical protein BCR41DRAFT_368790 [Lobosporangium transversale]ORZ24986.1 hypothetical protein BCR41DRAFT_368790 [Lobosporangium transversale]|eukprot:XP_021883967.1 hypothetical protein BCR41DRAFT_368790 [Lobosporangium transversale]